MSYFQDIQFGIRTTLKGLSLTLRHIRNATKRRTPEGIASENYFDLQNGLVTLQYPHEQLPIPDNGRYRLRNEIDDCIVCDKCAKICPVDCITIDAIKATEEVGRASDGSPIRLYAATFDIDMAKCCYCGLCTVVCPTECLTMDKKFDYSEFELGKLTYNFSNLTPVEADEKRELYEKFLREKEEIKAAQLAAKTAASAQSANADAQLTIPKATLARPVFRPTAKPRPESTNSEGSSIKHPLTDATPEEMQQIAQGGLETTKHPVFEPTQKLVTHVTDLPSSAHQGEKIVFDQKPVAPKPAFRPSMKPSAVEPPKPAVPDVKDTAEPEQAAPEPIAKPSGFRPTMKPPVNEPAMPSVSETTKEKPAFKPKMKPALPKPEEPKSDTPVSAEPSTPKPPAFRPTMKPAKPAENAFDEVSETLKPELPAPKSTAFRPTMKPAMAAPKVDEASSEVESQAKTNDEKVDAPAVEVPKPKPAFRPTMKPKANSDDSKAE